MAVAAKKDEAASGMPHIACPRCGTTMRLAVLEPLLEPTVANSNKNRMVFECRCGFEYRMSDKAASELSR